MVTDDQVVRSAKNKEVLELGRTVVADLQIVRYRIHDNRHPVRHIQRVLGRQKLAPVDQHPLTAGPVRCHATVFCAGHETVFEVKNQTRRRQQDPRCHFATLQFNIFQNEFGKLAEPAEIQNVFEPPEGEILCACGVVQGRIQGDCLLRDIL